MAQLPGFVLRIVLFEMSEKGCVRQVLEARSVVGHDVERSREVAGGVAIAVFALVMAGVGAEVSRGFVARDRSLVNSRHCGSVVRERGDGHVSEVVSGSHGGGLPQQAGLFAQVCKSLVRHSIFKSVTLIVI